MKKLLILSLSILLIPGIVYAQCSKEGDPALYVDFGEDIQDVYAGATYTWTLGPANFAFVSALCPDRDTFCVHVYDSAEWSVIGAPPLGDCHILDPGYLWWQDISVTVPCDVAISDYDTLIAIMVYCDITGTVYCDPTCVDHGGVALCECPNWYGGNPFYCADTVILHVVESPPSLYVLQDSIFYIEHGQAQAYVPFTICNGDMCDTLEGGFEYIITKASPIPCRLCDEIIAIIEDLIPGDCKDVHAIMDAASVDIGTRDTLTIIAWDHLTGTVYDTCVQIVEVVAVLPVPLLSTPIVAILVLAMIATTFLIIRKRMLHGA